MAENQRCARRGRTHFKKEQVQALKRVFEETMYPDWTWFKNQRVKRKKEQQQTGSNSSLESPNPNSSLESSNPTISGQEEEPSLTVTSANTHPRSPNFLDACDHELPQSSDNGQPGPSRWGSSWYSLPPDLQQICLGDSDPPWASSPYDIDQFMELYALPGDDDPRSLDQYLSPTCLG
ncbi:paired-like homeodomain transcription factor LEUTX [Canis lupus familiaris]|uniref:paired-like homeodomain transcription factor LEUTX n=1 Tax=Canis lupus familiaris TaxID=9615 RepID=UPI0015F185C0|nr:paired-like homeodomain transcription factor LEUTX [Canis lupus familiaris]XP_038381482.1 paired-like homeodomain transcription factor LEUTX [Canis lupus familiaris]XP_038509605.1 paired-like homeodomain transcription factor LEUTX [Canis lupus familiaris]